MARKNSPDTNEDRAKLKYHTSLKGTTVKCSTTDRACPRDGHMTRDEYVDAYRRGKNISFNPDLYYARRNEADPFSLNAIFGSASDSLEHRMINKEISREEYDAIKAGKKLPANYGYIDEVKDFFIIHKNKVFIPQGATVRSTNPKYNDTEGKFVTPKRLKVSLLHVCMGSGGFKKSPSTELSEHFQPVSLTWLGSDDYFYNVQVTDDILKANDPEK